MNPEIPLLVQLKTATPEQKKELEKTIRRQALRNVAVFIGIKVLLAISIHKLSKAAYRYAETLED